MTHFSRRFLLCAIGYVIIGMFLGIFMGATQDFSLAPVHAHMNLVGWASMGLFAYFYNAVPEAGETRLANAQFWIAQAGLLMLIPGLTMVLKENITGEPILIVGELLTATSMLLFGFTVFRHKAAS